MLKLKGIVDNDGDLKFDYGNGGHWYIFRRANTAALFNELMSGDNVEVEIIVTKIPDRIEEAARELQYRIANESTRMKGCTCPTYVQLADWLRELNLSVVDKEGDK